jgi:hypothetical protein
MNRLPDSTRTQGSRTERADLPADEIVLVADTVIMRPDPAAE